MKNLLSSALLSLVVFLNVNWAKAGLTTVPTNTPGIPKGLIFDMILKFINFLVFLFLFIPIFYYLPLVLSFTFLYYRNLKNKDGKEKEEKSKRYAKKIKTFLVRAFILSLIGFALLFISNITYYPVKMSGD